MNTVGGWACSAKGLRSVVRNPIYVALLILAIAVIILVATYKEPLKKAGGRKAARALVYGLVLVVGVLTVHNYAVRKEAEATANQKDIRDAFSST